ncbi:MULTISPECIES: hypothetical protein [Arthrobacter]|uniref:hypothetical protein n=1 Tax=Arthrobacter TaxID=1663 RepID=UPI0016067538|nr:MULTISPECIES: hypothetical protein [Arthrobacter]QYF90385.1 hypothetical protein KY499_03435 [Arthrobacter sp. PAMC25284]
MTSAAHLEEEVALLCNDVESRVAFCARCRTAKTTISAPGTAANRGIRHHRAHH